MLRLQEKPIEWVKFTAVIGVAVNLVLWILWGKHRLPLDIPLVAAGIALAALITSILQPRWFRGFYRVGMTASFHLGQVIGKVMLTLLFFLLVTPLGQLLRVLGKDLLDLKPPPNEKSGWRPARNTREFDRLF